MPRIRNPKAKGTVFENIVKKLIKKANPNSEVFRSPASLGSADLIQIERWVQDGQSGGAAYVRLIQCKYLKKYMSKKETIKLLDDAKRIGAYPVLVYRKKPRGEIIFEDLHQQEPVLAAKSHSSERIKSSK